MLSYVQQTLIRAKSDGIIIHVGTNVSAKSKRPSDIADSIISVGKKCQNTGVWGAWGEHEGLKAVFLKSK